MWRKEDPALCLQSTQPSSACVPIWVLWVLLQKGSLGEKSHIGNKSLGLTWGCQGSEEGRKEALTLPFILRVRETKG